MRVRTIIHVKDKQGNIKRLTPSFVLPDGNYSQPEELSCTQWYDWEDKVVQHVTKLVSTWSQLQYRVMAPQSCTICVAREHV